jgi:hypothetical protein
MNSDAPSTSWGKAGVSFSDYLTDASACASAAANVHAPPEDLIQTHVTGGVSATPGSAEAAQASNDALLATANEMRDRQVHADEHARLMAEHQCLQQRGYTQFRLTPEQRAHAQALPADSVARANYLHQLAADPQVVSAQHM